VRTAGAPPPPQAPTPAAPADSAAPPATPPAHPHPPVPRLRGASHRKRGGVVLRRTASERAIRPEDGVRPHDRTSLSCSPPIKRPETNPPSALCVPCNKAHEPAFSGAPMDVAGSESGEGGGAGQKGHRASEGPTRRCPAAARRSRRPRWPGSRPPDRRADPGGDTQGGVPPDTSRSVSCHQRYWAEG